LRTICSMAMCIVVALAVGGCASQRKPTEGQFSVGVPEVVGASVPFRVGERLTYDVYFGLMRAATAEVVLQEIVNVGDRPTYHIVLTVNTTPTFSKIFKVDDKVETYVDTEQFIPLKFAKSQHEGDYDHEEVSTLDQTNHQGHYESLTSGMEKDYDLPDRCQDSLSVLCLLRLLPLEVGKTFAMKVMADEEIWEVRVKVEGEVKRTIYQGGSYDTFLLVANVNFDAGTLQKGRGRLWLTTDERRLLVCLKTKLAFGYLTFAMVKADNIYEDSAGEEGEPPKAEPNEVPGAQD
jgi:hypothetical protein